MNFTHKILNYDKIGKYFALRKLVYIYGAGIEGLALFNYLKPLV